MSKTLTELWYGNVIPHEHKRDYSPIRNLTELSKRNRAALVATLTPEQKSFWKNTKVALTRSPDFVSAILLFMASASVCAWLLRRWPMNTKIFEL